MRKKLIIVAVALAVLGGLCFLSVPWYVASYTEASYGWPEVVRKIEGPSCGGPCAPGVVHHYFKKDCLGVVLKGPIVSDGRLPSYCVGAVKGDWQETGRGGS